MRVRYLILGAGPTGLGAAQRLSELGESDYLVLEREAHPGGLSASFSDDSGFTWDVGGHVFFSHYDYVDRLLTSLLGEDVLRHERVAYIRIQGTWVPYPFQNNIRHLPPAARWECVQGLLDNARAHDKPANFGDWVRASFGAGISRLFMEPYNFKVWATPLELMSASWVGERVSVVDVRRVLKNIVLEEDDVGWGPNNRFLFPLRGGTGEIFRRLADRHRERIRYNAAVVSLDPAAGTVTTASGETVGFTRLLSTLPLDLLAGRLLAGAPESLVNAAGSLAHNAVHVVGLGIAGTRPDPKCWMYFPEDDCPFYRVTNFHNYSPGNVARPGRQRGLMCETSSSPHKTEDLASLPGRTIAGLAKAGFFGDTSNPEIVSVWQHTADYGYPVPTLGRDAALAAIQPALERLGIASRGRFGGYRYEVGNMDHSLMQGVEWADREVRGTPETTYRIPQQPAVTL
jgi:UDP-galactopyranose mutase